MDPIPATSQRWTDIDRFVNAPLEYVRLYINLPLICVLIIPADCKVKTVPFHIQSGKDSI